MRRATLIAGLAAITTSCADGGGSGTLEMTLYGEDFIEQEIPAAAGPGEEGFVDGWTIRFSRFLLCLGDLSVEDHDGEVGAEDPTFRIFDMHPAGPHVAATFEGVGARRWPEVTFTMAPADQDTVAGNASAADVELMQDNGWSVYAEGTAEDGDAELSFAWGFETATRFGGCHHDDFGEGVVVPAGGVESAQITIHGDHFFYDDLQSPDTVLRFDAIAAADADADGEVTLAELSAVDLTNLPEGTYGTGGAGTVEDLAAFVTALSRTLGHWRGEGHCQASDAAGN